MTASPRPAWRPLTDAEWANLAPLVAARDPRLAGRAAGRRRMHPRAVLDACVYQAITGCAWNRLPAELGDDATVHRTYLRWKTSGLLGELFAAITEAAR